MAPSRPSILLWHWGSAGAGAKFTLDLATALRHATSSSCHVCATRDSELAARSLWDAQFRSVPEPPRRLRGILSTIRKSYKAASIPSVFARILDQTRPDVAVCTMQTIWDLFALPSLKRRGDIRYILILHDAWFRVGDTYPLRAWAQRRQVAAADGLVVLSDHVGAIARQTFGFPTGRMQTIPHAAFRFGDGAFEPRTLPSKRPVRLLFLGRIVAYKGLSLLLAAYRILCERGVPVSLSIVGDGELSREERHALETLLNVTTINRWVSDEEIQAALRENDVAILPYVEATQSGIAAAAFAAALPIVATPVGGLIEQVAHAKTGLIATAVTASALATSIEELVRSRDLYADLSAGALRHARADLSWDASAAALLHFSETIRRLPKRAELHHLKDGTLPASTLDPEVQP